MAILTPGDVVLSVHRRLYAGDAPRFFIGKVEAYEDGVAAATGYTWARDMIDGNVTVKPQLRTKLLAISSGSLLIYRLPKGTDVNSTRLEMDADGQLWVVDGRSVRLDLREKP